MLLYVMRHGPAEDRAPTGRDFDRVLTEAGRAVVERAAHALHDMRRRAGSRPWRVLSSPYPRAKQTAEIVVATAAPGPALELHVDLAAEEDVPFGLVRELCAAGTDVLLVSHQPMVEELCRALVRPARLGLPSGFRTATIVALEHVIDERWTPAAILDPHAAR